MTVPIDPTRLKTAASAVGTDRPQLATILAQSPLSGTQIQQVGGFAQAMTVNTVNNLAMDSGAQTNYTATQQDQLDGLGVKPANPKPQPADDSRSFLEKAGAFVANAVGNTGSFLLHNPVTGAIEDVGNWLGNATHLPFRMLSTALHGDGAEVDREMAADGYDPSKASSYINFMFNQGEQVYHDLSGVRGTYGDDDVDLAIQIQRDPQGWQDQLEKMDPTQAAALSKKVNSDTFQQAYAAVDSNHVSPGRDLAGLLTFGHKDNAAYHALSGVLDAAYDWFTDPTLILGKTHAAITALDAAGRTAEGAGIFQRGLQSVANNVEWLGNKRAGIEHMTDQVGISALLRTDENGKAVTAVGKGWEQFLTDAKQLRETAAIAADKTLPAEAQAAAAAQRAGVWRAMVNRYGQTLMPLLDEVNGKAVLEAGEKGTVEGMTAGASGHLTTDGEPIETLDQMRDYLVSKNGLLRLNNGMAAKRDVIMPGKLSLRAQAKAAVGMDTSAAASATAQRTASKATWDYTDAGKMLPVAEEAGLTVGADGRITSAAADGDAQNALLTKSVLTSVQAARAKADRLSRKFTSLIPSVDHVDLTDPNSGRIVEQIARTYLNKGDSARLASAYAVGDIAQRRAVLKGTLEQVFHASGLSKSEDGQAMMDKYLSDLDRGSDVTQQYGFDNSSVIQRGSDATPTQAALYPDQLSNKVLIPSFREMNFIAAKTAASGFARKTGLAGFNRLGQSDAMDHLLGTIKLGWIASAAGGMRNALDEVANFAVNGMGREVLAARSAFTRATKDLRAERRGYSQDYLAMLKDENGFTVSRKVVNQKIGEQVGAAHASVLDARAKLDQATKSAAADPDGLTTAQQGLTAAHKEFQRAVGLQTAIHYRVPYAFRKAADTMNDVFIGTALGKAMSVFGAKYAVTPERVKIAQELVNSELTQTLREGVFQSHYADSGAMLGSDDYAMALHHSGLQARKYSYQSVSKGWGVVEADGGTGLDAMAKTLQLRFADPKSPAHSWVQTILPMLGPDGQVTQEALDAATASVRARLEDPDLRHFLAQAEVFKHTRAGEAVGDSEALANQAKDEYAQRVSLDLVHALARRGSEDGTASAGINRGLLEQIFDGWHNETGPPDRSWLAQNLPTEERPATAIGQLWAPYNPAHAPGTTPRGYTQMMTAAYDKVVTDQINAISRNPLMTALYMNARENTKPYVKALQEAGWDEDSATEVAKQISLRQAQDQAFQHIDNPYVASQFAVVNRNFAAFWRAQEDWLRRWGRTVKDNPQVIRQAQLLIHGGQTAGLVEHDDQGNLTFVYPGSSLMLGLFSKAFGKLTGANPSQLPVAGELTSQLAFANPSLDNPLGLTGTPLISLPFKAITALMGPQHAVLSSSLDQVVNGQLGANRQWWEQLLPSWASRILGGVLSTDPGSKYGAAFTGALANMEAAGQLDDPKYQTASGKAELMQNLQAAVHNQLAATALFGFSPLGVAAPTLDLEGTGGQASAIGTLGLGSQGKAGHGNAADWSAHIAGLQSLKDEAREVFSKLPYDQALAWWQAVHPGELVYAQTGSTSRTQVGAKSANAPATTRAATWLEQNAQFASAEKYGGKGGVASYFIPQGAPGSQDGSYNQVAYDAEMQAGIRQYKSLDDYFDDIVTAQGLREYYAAKDDYDAQKSSLTASGNKSGLKGLEAQWAAVKGDIEQRNPLVAAKLAAGAVDTASVATQIGQLTQMVQDTSPETVKALGANRAGVAALLQARAAYEEGTAALANRNSKSANTARRQLRDNYTAAVTAIAGTTTYGPHNQRTVTAGQFPELADLARGVFRLPN